MARMSVLIRPNSSLVLTVDYLIIFLRFSEAILERSASRLSVVTACQARLKAHN